MRPIDLNLATRPYRNDTPLAIALLVLLAAAAGLTAHNTHSYLTADAREQQLLEELSDHRQRMEQMKAEAKTLRDGLDEIDFELLDSQANFVAGILEERNFSWTGLFNALERVLPWNIRLSSIRPRFEIGLVRVELLGVARDNDAYLDFQDTLLRADGFGGVVPGDFQIDESTEQVFFTLGFDYTPQAPDTETMQAAAAPVEVLVVEDTGGSEDARAERAPAEPPADDGTPRGRAASRTEEPPSRALVGEPADALASESAAPSERPRQRGRRPEAAQRAGTGGAGDARGAAGEPAQDAGSMALLPAPAGARGSAAGAAAGPSAATGDRSGPSARRKAAA
ncbi:MAG: hypothetical protein JSV80_05590, partial [Acidobacteriota bacterium]